MQPDERIIPQRMALRPDHIKAGFSIALAESENCWVIRRRGIFYRRFGAYTPMTMIHADLDACIETGKVVTMEPFTVGDFGRVA